MILLIAIVQSEDAAQVTSRLLEKEFRVTRINSSGGFLAAGNAAILVGVDDERCDEVIALIGATCRSRTRYINAAPWTTALANGSVAFVAPMEVTIGGAVIFGFPVRRFVRLRGGTEPNALDKTYGESEEFTVPTEPSPTETEQAPAMTMMVAIVQKEDVEEVTSALLAGGHRLTRINTAGGFLRRGNATLLIGVQAHQVDEVLGMIKASCRPRTEPNPLEEGIPMYGATVFVLDASRFVRV